MRKAGRAKRAPPAHYGMEKSDNTPIALRSLSFLDGLQARSCCNQPLVWQVRNYRYIVLSILQYHLPDVFAHVAV